MRWMIKPPQLPAAGEGEALVMTCTSKSSPAIREKRFENIRFSPPTKGGVKFGQIKQILITAPSRNA